MAILYSVTSYFATGVLLSRVEAVSVAAAVLLFFCLGLFLSPRNRLGASLCFIAVYAAVYGAEAFLQLTMTRGRIVAETAHRLGREADRRSMREVVADYRRLGIDAYPCCVSVWDYVGARPALASANSRGEFLPLASVSNRLIVLCNESGSYITYQSDEHGFRNPQGIWETGPIQVAVLGDSFTLGMCVEAGDHFVDHLRSHYPATLNLGIRGIGPLIMLAALKEYAAPTRPRNVIWVFFENDLDDLRLEKGVPLLMNYVASDFRQNLLRKQKEIDRAAAGIVQAKLPKLETFGEEWRERTFDLLRLSILRRRLLWEGALPFERQREEDFQLFEKILSNARATVSSWGGELYFVYLPDIRHYSGGRGGDNARLSGMYRRVKEIVAREQVPLADLHQKFSEHGDPTSLYFYPGSHYTEAGYRIVGETILRVMGTTN